MPAKTVLFHGGICFSVPFGTPGLLAAVGGRGIHLELTAAEATIADLVVPRERGAVRERGGARIDVARPDSREGEAEPAHVGDHTRRPGVLAGGRRFECPCHRELVNPGGHASSQRVGAEGAPNARRELIGGSPLRFGRQRRFQRLRRQRRLLRVNGCEDEQD